MRKPAKRSRWCAVLAVAVVSFATGCSSASDTARANTVKTSPPPSLPLGDPCTVTKASDPIRPSQGLGDMLGDGPVRPVGLDSAARLTFGASAGSEWGNGKVVWAVAPGFADSVVVSGHRVGGLSWSDSVKRPCRTSPSSYRPRPPVLMTRQIFRAGARSPRLSVCNAKAVTHWRSRSRQGATKSFSRPVSRSCRRC